MRSSRLLTAAAAALGLAACATPNVSTVAQKYPLYRPAHSNYAMNGRDILVVVQGSSYGAAPGDFRHTVLDIMQRFRSSLNTRFTDKPQNNYNKDYKIVLLFNGSPSAEASELCRQTSQYGSISSLGENEMRMMAVFCRFDAPLTEVIGRATGVKDSNDPNFASLIQQTMTDLFPLSGNHPHHRRTR